MTLLLIRREIELITLPSLKISSNNPSNRSEELELQQFQKYDLLQHRLSLISRNLYECKIGKTHKEIVQNVRGPETDPYDEVKRTNELGLQNQKTWRDHEVEESKFWVNFFLADVKEIWLVNLIIMNVMEIYNNITLIIEKKTIIKENYI